MADKDRPSSERQQGSRRTRPKRDKPPLDQTPEQQIRAFHKEIQGIRVAIVTIKLTISRNQETLDGYEEKTRGMAVDLGIIADEADRTGAGSEDQYPGIHAVIGFLQAAQLHFTIAANTLDPGIVFESTEQRLDTCYRRLLLSAASLDSAEKQMAVIVAKLNLREPPK